MAGASLQRGVPYKFSQALQQPHTWALHSPFAVPQGKNAFKRGEKNSEEWGRKMWEKDLKALKGQHKEEGDKVILLQPVEHKPYVPPAVIYLN